MTNDLKPFCFVQGREKTIMWVLHEDGSTYCHYPSDNVMEMCSANELEQCDGVFMTYEEVAERVALNESPANTHMERAWEKLYKGKPEG